MVSRLDGIANLLLSPEQKFLETAYKLYLDHRKRDISKHEVTEMVRTSGKILFQGQTYRITTCWAKVAAAEVDENLEIFAHKRLKVVKIST
ncbi:MAG: hypothetical protein AB7G93_15940 [Bdellovibrionales bacterium]